MVGGGGGGLGVIYGRGREEYDKGEYKFKERIVCEGRRRYLKEIKRNDCEVKPTTRTLIYMHAYTQDEGDAVWSVGGGGECNVHRGECIVLGRRAYTLSRGG